MVGIDGGSTYSFGVAVDRTGCVLATARAGTMNFFGAGISEARRNLTELVRSLELKLPLGNHFEQIVLGSQALFVEATPEQKERLCKGILHLTQTRMVSHSMISYYGACLGSPAVLIFGGTGSIVLSQNERGEYFQTGGWGHLLGDEGGAYWISVESIKAAIASIEGRGEETGLVEAICQWFEVKELSEIMSQVYENKFSKDRLGSMSERLAEWLGTDDPVFTSICQRGGVALAEQAKAAIKLVDLHQRPITTFLLGGVLIRNQIVRQSLIETIEKDYPIQIQEPLLSPLLGAAALAMNASGIPLSENLVVRLNQSYENHLKEQKTDS